MSAPTRVNESLAMRPGESIAQWSLRQFGPPAAEAQHAAPCRSPDAAPAVSPRWQRANALLERSLPPSHVECRLDAPELSKRVCGAAIGIGGRAFHEPRVCFIGASRAGKTSLAVAMLRAWVARYERRAMFFAAHRLGVARLQHPAGHGEAPLVEAAMDAPLVLLDDLGSERDFPSNPIADVIFERHARDLPTWVTTGLSRDALVVRYGAGVTARLFERARVIHLGPKTSSTKTTASQK